MGFPDFTSFYRDVNGREPFPWQARLANAVIDDGWPSQIGVPTGLGKTACIDIAVWALAAQAGSGKGRTRLWYVVNRRLLVDQAWDHGCHVAGLLAEGVGRDGNPSGALIAVRDALVGLTPLGTQEGPIQVVRLRGGAETRTRPLEPSQPALIFATVDMFASRWLFRGYGTSRSMRPIDAALAGTDSLVLLDEAHLARPLLTLADAVALCDVGDPSSVLAGERARPRFVSLTATGDPAPDRFDLDDADLANPVVSTRLAAPKDGTLLASTDKSLPASAAEQALALIDEGDALSCVVFVNSPKTARAVVAELERMCAKRDPEPAIAMATGRMREREAQVVRARLLDPHTGVPAGRAGARTTDAALIVVATQTLEVGADLDFDALVTETAGRRALIQRLGRLNRLGWRPTARAVVIHPGDRKAWPVYGDEVTEAWDALVAARDEGALDLTPRGVARTLGAPRDDPPRTGELLRAHLWEWAKTSRPPEGEAPVALFFSGFDDGYAQAEVAWRLHVPDQGQRLIPGPRQAEFIELPVWELREALGSVDRAEVSRLSDDQSTLEVVPIARIRPGDRVVLECGDGLYDQHGWDPGSREAVLDVGLMSSGRLLLTPQALAGLAPGFPPHGVPQQLVDPGEEGPDRSAEGDLLSDLVGRLRESQPHPWLEDGEWVSFLDGLDDRIERPVDGEPFVPPKPRVHTVVAPRQDAFDELSFDVISTALADHMGSVGAIAMSIAGALGLDDVLCASLQIAGRLHDVGKRDPRFQRWLATDTDPGHTLAKSGLSLSERERARRAAGWPRGGRHELLSSRMAAVWLSQRPSSKHDEELVLHLIASHHGYGRPLVPVVGDAFPPSIVFDLDGSTIEARCDLSDVDWEQPARFRRLCERYGYWGLALLEAILRQSDHVASSRVEVD